MVATKVIEGTGTLVINKSWRQSPDHNRAALQRRTKRFGRSTPDRTEILPVEPTLPKPIRRILIGPVLRLAGGWRIWYATGQPHEQQNAR